MYMMYIVYSAAIQLCPGICIECTVLLPLPSYMYVELY